MNNVVSASSRNNYNRVNKHFVLYLFNQRENPAMRDCIDEAVMNIFEEKNEISEKELKKTITKYLDRFVNADSCFFNVANITFEVFSNYVISRRNENRSYSNSYYQGLRSALMHIFRTASYEPPQELFKETKKFMAGLRRTVASDIQELGISCEQGKSPMTFALYRRLCQKLVSSPKAEDIFTRAWITLEWSLMARADNMVRSHINHIEWRDDSLVIFFSKSKTNQDGLDKNVPWHIHSNPNEPAICPVHALGIYLFTNPHLLSAESKLFPGELQYKHYSTILMNRIEEWSDDLSAFGNCSNLGSHSIRKGSASFAASGSTVAPSIVSMCMWVGWTISGTKERYLKFENAGDCFVSRIGAGLNPTSHEFGVSPAYFEFQDEGEEQMVNLFLREMFGDVMDESIGGMIRMLLASVCKSHEWLVGTMHANNPFRASLVYANLTPDIVSLAKTSYPWNKTNRTPSYTGIPPHVGILNMLEGIRQGQMRMENGIVDRLVAELDERGTFGGFNANRMRDIMETAFGGVREDIRQMRDQHEGGRVADGDDGGGAEGRRRSRFELHYWGEKFRRLPQHWTLPKGMNLKALYHLWFLGSIADEVPPFCTIASSKEVDHLKRGPSTFQDMQYIMKNTVRALHQQQQGHLLVENVADWTVDKVNRVYAAVVDRF